MHVMPVLIDDTPAFAEGSDTTVLSLPCGGETVGELWAEWLGLVSYHAPRRLDARVNETSMTLPRLVREPLAWFDPFDWVLLVSSRLLPLSSDGLEMLRARHDGGERAVLHLLASERAAPGSREVVHATPAGGVRRIQRYLDPRTMWNRNVGVVASLVPVSALLQLDPARAVHSLEQLRARLVELGIPAADVTDPSPVFDVHDEEGALAFVQQRVRESAPHRSGDQSSRLRGPVVIEPGADVALDALVVGPALISEGARVESGARIAQSVLLPGSIVRAGESVRHRVLAGDAAAIQAMQQRRHTPSRVESPERVAIGAHNVGYLRLRSIVESVIAFVMLVLLSPLYLGIALIVKLTSRGDVFYGDPREGLNGRRFKCWKFRTMRPDAHAMQRELAAEQFADGPHFKIKSDPRMTPIGRWLRALNLDEMPQLFNVLLREMSFVGPRPSPFKENQICAPWRKARLAVRPGITGLWQVCRHDRASGDFHQWIEYDLLYVEHVSLAVDLRILAATIRTLGGRTHVPVESILPGVSRTVSNPTAPVDHARRAAAIRAERRALQDAGALEAVP
jgi:lipopolysaccharide/colanic/teichoic acid biosynthesis glycosyltransferase